ncbi:YcxB family protein [Proteiniclasticum sp.]|uniref:YcxB family protein n=1 Tax=Proteiniclasticum sp. TaxID=2053595 RepID=UPI0028A122AB|nr:YcxB family protein [Proteiniclasticum sp.]
MERLEEPKFNIETTMTKEDYKKFLYIATFRRNRLLIPLMIFMSIIGSVVIGFDTYGFSWVRFILSFLVLTPSAFVIIIFQIERKNAKRIKTDQTGSFDSINKLTFYEDKMMLQNEAFKSTGEVQYVQFYGVRESKDYFIFYLTVNQAALIRKIDVKDVSGFRSFLMNKLKERYKKI